MNVNLNSMLMLKKCIVCLCGEWSCRVGRGIKMKSFSF